MSEHPKLAYGLEEFDFFTGKREPIQWFDTLQDAEREHQKRDYPWACIYVMGLATRITSIYYKAAGLGAGYGYFGIYPDVQELCEQNGITDEVILGKDWGK